ncbi:ATP-binding protein [Colwellia hornerae]|uniref:histidine kinase n=1 Tax=Colwellia hornerae TaxID=89402 RepID=A0A5C6QHP6_9GAMM|nr:ATP-binding protein [Colwellia hornerae]TWX52866.1 response regulator [Colwellia hornerae]TWX59220.1 response regulator [Colwellia hornerae]TWX68248.1 response regulator [Colwellia hornerae]
MNEKIKKIIFSENIMVLIAIAFVVTPLIIFFLFSFNLFSASLTDSIKNENNVKSALLTNNINNFISERISDAKVISQADIFESQDLTASNEYIIRVMRQSQWINNIDVIDKTGIIITSSGIKNNKGTLIWAKYPIQKSLFVSASKARQGQVYISKVMTGDSGVSVLFIIPITRKESLPLIGLLAIQVNFEHITNVIALFSQGNISNKHAYIVDNDAKIILSSDPAVKFQDSLAGLQVKPQWLNNLLLRDEIGNVNYTNHSGDKVMLGYADMAKFGENKTLDWRLITITPLHYITAPVKRILFIIGSVIALLSGLLTYRAVVFFNNKLTVLARQELAHLAVQADAISKGHSSIGKRVESTGKGAISTLVIAINRMQENVHQTFKRLEEQQYILDSHAIVCTTDTSGLITYANDKFSEIYGYSNAELIGKNHKITNSSHHPAEFFTEIWQTIASGNLWQGEICNKSKNGDLYWMFSTLGPNFDSRGKVIQYTAISTDITSIKRTDELLRRTQKLEAIGELSGGIAHDFNNLLAIIIGNIDLMELNVETGSHFQKQLKDTLVAALHAAEITRRLLNFSRETGSTHSQINIIDIFNEYKNFIQKSVTASIILEINISDDIWLVDMNKNEFQDAIVNLSLNARDAMPTGGTLLFEASNKTLNDNRVGNNSELEAGEYVEIVISDSGKGIYKEDINNIFDPFFTTKDKSKGTGLGLSMVFGFVKRCNGSITVSSKRGLGTIFKIYLPRSKNRANVKINLTEIDKQPPLTSNTWDWENSHLLSVRDKAHTMGDESSRFSLQHRINDIPALSPRQSRFIGSWTHLDDIKNLTVQLQQSQKIAVRNEYTRTIAHDFNNMLGIVLGYSELLVEHEGAPTEIIDYALEINHAGLRWAKLTRKLLSLAQDKPLGHEIYDINQIIQDTRNILSKILTANIELNVNLTDNLGPTKINVHAFEELLLFFCIHLIDAMPNGGSLNITTANETLNSEQANHLSVKQGDYISVSIADSLKGMSEKMIKTVFEPFFTTKDEQNKKWGLTQLNNLVFQGGGAIGFKSGMNTGPQFTIYFPKDITVINSTSVNNPSAVDLSAQPKIILVVDDEKALRVLAKSILEVDGYKIETVSSAGEALIFLETHQVDLMFTDIIMPIMNGYQLANSTQELYPNIPILFTSGYHKEDEYLQYKTTYDVNLLYKPYRAKDLRSRVSKMLKLNETKVVEVSKIQSKTDNEI